MFMGGIGGEPFILNSFVKAFPAKAPDMPLQVPPPKPQLDSDLMMQD